MTSYHRLKSGVSRKGNRMDWSKDMSEWYPNLEAGDCIHVLGKDCTTTGLYHLTMYFQDTPELDSNMVYDEAKTMAEAKKKFTALKKEFGELMSSIHPTSKDSGYP